jgi:hypothetical protein
MFSRLALEPHDCALSDEGGTDIQSMFQESNGGNDTIMINLGTRYCNYAGVGYVYEQYYSVSIRR